MLPRHRRTKGQAIVEFALASTLIFFLLAAVVDLGLIFFTLQALRTAAQEGATFGSYPVAIYKADGSLDRVELNYPAIVGRVYGAGGEQTGGFANLNDLNGNGLDDLNVDKLHNNMSTDPEAFIYIENLKGVDPEQLAPSCKGNVKGTDLQNGGKSRLTGQTYCWVRVTVRYNYHMLFPFAPAFADTVRLQVSHLMPIRSSFYTTP